jgi:hypothetical protein
MDVVCLKWGDKFNHEHVNRLYKMVCKNLDGDFNFICYTENSNNIDSRIIIRPLANYDLEKWWWKLTLFEHATKNITLFLDLDVVIQNNITHFKDYCVPNKICTIKAYWKPHRVDMKPIAPNFDMNLNSSIMIWQGNLTNVWKTFIKDPEYYVFKYSGIDSFLYFHHFDKLNWLRPGEVYSRLYGYDENNYNIAGENICKFHYKKDFNICIFNGWRRKKSSSGEWLLDDEGYKGFEKYY